MRFNKRGVDKIKLDGVTKTFFDVLTHMKRPVRITPGTICYEPGMNKHNGSISIKKRKQYSQAAPSGRKRNKISKGDLMIGLIHTQDGLVAFSKEDAFTRN